MHIPHLTSTALPAWSKLNDVNYIDIKIDTLSSSKGQGLVTTKALNSIDTHERPVLLRIPKELVLSKEFLEEYAKVDGAYREVKEVVGGKTFRTDVLVFLLLQTTIASSEHAQDDHQASSASVGISGPWTEYVKMLPRTVPVPTMWTEVERELLVGTSLETALTAKLSTLYLEFDSIQDATSIIPWCQTHWWTTPTPRLTASHYILLDALFRSRSLSLPHSGTAMVPCLDMANHSSSPNAYYEETAGGDVILLLRPGMRLGEGEEITISYCGEGGMDAVEMVFSYGFLDEESTKGSGMTLMLETMGDDPFGKAKVVAFQGAPIVKITVDDGGKVGWESPFLHLMVLNEEDGLDFRVLQQTDGTRSSLRVFWEELDVTDRMNDFEALTADHTLKDIFRLRAVTILEDRVRQQMKRLAESEYLIQTLSNTESGAKPDRYQVAVALRMVEGSTMIKVLQLLEREAKLLEQENVLQYLGALADDENQGLEKEGAIEEEDFS